MKAQAWSMDFAASMVIFSTALLLILFAWNYAVQQSHEQTSFNVMENAAIAASDSLIRHGGSPEGWSQADVMTIGLASSENVINETKAESLMQVNDTDIKRLLGIGNYEFYLEIRYANGSMVSTPGGQVIQKGIYPTTATTIIPVERQVLYMDKMARLKLIVWS
jgi:uncharacterized membrane-anchored protein